MFIQIGYGLEGALPDVTCFDITQAHHRTAISAGRLRGRFATGIDLMMQAVRGEYKGTGKTNSGSERSGSGRSPLG